MPEGRADVAALVAHDHAACRRSAQARAEALCGEGALNLTPIRRQVFDILLEEHVALGAYDILRKLAEAGRQAQPPAAYRALDHLMAHGLAHKIEGLNAYVACTAAHEEGDPVFMVCRACRKVAETSAHPRDGLTDTAREAGFVVERTVVEVLGTCADCSDKDEE